MNKVMLIGHIGNEPETKTFDNGNQVTNFSFATDESYKDANGNKVDKTEWHQIKCFGKLAEVAQTYFAKGKKLFIEGKIQTRSWQNDQGENRYVTEILMKEFVFLDKKEQVPFGN